MIDRQPPADSHPALRRGVDALLALEPDYDVDAGAQRFERGLGRGAAQAPGLATRTRLVIVTAVVAIAGAAIVGMRAPEQPRTLAPALASMPSAPSVEPTPPAPIDDGAIAIAEPVEPPIAVANAPLVAASKTSKPARARARAQTQPEIVAAEPAPTADDTLAREMALLDTTRKHLVARKAEAARETIAVARTTLTRLRFDEEWEALEILALAGAGELTRAESRASVFLVAHPNGRFNASIEAALARARAQ
jgi:hypothetical protein